MQILISLPAQTLELFDETGLLVRRYMVSTARKGAGEEFGSYCTPRGRHVVRARIGAGCRENTVFVRRRPTGEVWTTELAANVPDRDWILTRILWLSGCEPGVNRLGRVDTMRRYIYLHGSPDTVSMGEPGSIGCVRMRNRDIIELFELLPAGSAVNIVEFRVVNGDWHATQACARFVRQTVFIEEHGVAEVLEWDDLDALSAHALALDPAGSPVGTGRLLADGRIGRLAVLAPWRNKGVGTALLWRLLTMARAAGMRQVYLHARVEAAPFYARYGFEVEGAPYLETGTPHITMRRALPA